MSAHHMEDPSLPKLTMTDGTVALWPVLPDDHEFLFHCSTSEWNNVRWRYHGHVPSVHAFAEHLYSDVHAHFVVRLVSGEPLGYVVAYAANLRSRHVHVGALFSEPAQGQRFGTRALALFIGYLFDVWDLNGVFAEVPEYTLAPIESTSSGLPSLLPFEIVGRRPRFHYQNGQYWDDFIVYLPIEAWRDRPSVDY
jgi:RimJ/RimL family protein N-acetyltransferase